MKRQVVLFSIAVTAAVLLGGCSKATSEGASARAGSGNSAASGNATAIAGGAGVEAVAAGEQVAPAQGAGSQGTGQETPLQEGGDASQSAAAAANPAPAGEDTQQVPTDGFADGNGTYDIDHQSGDSAPEGGTWQEAATWDGIFSLEDKEQLTITQTDEFAIRFSFANSGIGGTADVDGTQAIYQGDDHMDVTFLLSGNSVSVSVTNADTNALEESVIIGTYQRQ